MSENFELPVWYHGKELLFPAELLPMGYSHKIKITVNDTDLLFEPDEERHYRALIAEADRESVLRMDQQLLGAICETLDELFA